MSFSVRVILGLHPDDTGAPSSQYFLLQLLFAYY